MQHATKDDHHPTHPPITEALSHDAVHDVLRQLIRKQLQQPEPATTRDAVGLLAQVIEQVRHASFAIASPRPRRDS